MRTVVKPGEVYHLWAHQTQDHARGGNCSFLGTRAYSYAQCIGNIVTNAQGEKIFLVIDWHYSVTTAGHISGLRRAIPDTETVIAVHAPSDSASFNLDRMSEKLPDMMKKIVGSRKHGQYLLAEYLQYVESIRKFCAFFGLDTPEMPTLPEEIMAKVSAKTAEELKAKKEIKARQQENLTKWLNGEYVWELPQDFAYLRIASNGQTVQTTFGATVPLSDVTRAADTVLKLMAAGKTVAPKGIRFGFYDLSIVTPEYIKVGCHTIKKEEVQRFAEVLKSRTAAAA